jgi:hypothetical protein
MKVNLLLKYFNTLLLIFARMIKFSRADELILNASLTLLTGHGLMVENDWAIRSGGYAIIPCVLAP